MKITCLLYTHNAVPVELFEYVLSRLDMFEGGWEENELIVLTNQHLNHGRKGNWSQQIVYGKPGLHDCYTKIIKGCELAQADTIFLLEHDVLYPPNYLAFVPPRLNVFYYNMNLFTANARGFWETRRLVTSNVCGGKELMLETFKHRLDYVNRGGRVDWNEPGRCCCDTAPYASYELSLPVIDLRWGGNLTGHRDAPQDKYLERIPYWPPHAELWPMMGLEKAEPNNTGASNEQD